MSQFELRNMERVALPSPEVGEPLSVSPSPEKEEKGSSVQQKVMLRHNQQLRAKILEIKKDYERQLTEMRAQLADKNTEIETAAIKKMEMRLNSAVKRADIAKNKLDVISPRVKKLSTENRELKTELESGRAAWDEERTRLTERVEELEAKAEVTAEAIKAAHASLRSELDEVHAKADELETNLNQEQAEHETVKTELVRVFSERNQLEAQHTQALEEIVELKSANQELRGQLDGMANRYVSLGEKVTFEGNKNQLLSKEVARLKATIEEQDKELFELRHKSEESPFAAE